MLANWGVPVKAAASARKGLDLLQNERFDLLLVDGEMPEMDGIAMAQHIREMPEFDGLKIIMLTSANLMSGAEQLGKLNVARYLIKPVASHDLREAILTSCASLVASVARARHRQPFSEALSKMHHALSILVAEDNLVNQKLACKVLEKIGHKVTIAHNGREAVEFCEQEKFDVVFMDVQMPEMDGLSATAEIRRRPHLADQKIYAMTAHAMSGDKERCLAIGMNGYLTKPLQMDELRRVLLEIETAVTSGYVAV
jgi:CheY-like chemotaxis protein